MKMIKNFAFLLMTTTLFSTSAMAANHSGTPETERSQLRTEVLSFIEKTNINELDAEARLSFMVTARDEIVVLHVNTKDRYVERMLKSQLNYKKVKTNLSKKNQIYYMDINFKIE